MKKVKIGFTFLLLVALCLLCGNVVLLCNYLIALVFHEIAHILVATRKGYLINQINVDMFGLAVDLHEKIDEKDQFDINIAGPACNLLICLLCLATYWLFPISYIYLNTFCLCNFILAVFNLLPIYPLDGGKILRGLIKSDKAYKISDKVIRYSLAFISICTFFVSCFNDPNFFFLILSIFFITSNANTTPTMSIFKYRKNKHFDKVVILKVNETETLFNLLKQIKSHHYTVFYTPKLNKYFNEDDVIEMSLQNPLTTQILDLN